MTKEELKEINNYRPIVNCSILDLYKLVNSKCFCFSVGQRISLPEFTVPSVIIDGENRMEFEEHKIKDNAIIYKITDKYIYLVFEHCLFQTEIDLNNQTKWKKTQLYQYLHITFKKAMKDAGIKAKKVNLLSYDEVFGKCRLDYFKYAKNRIASTLDESCTEWWWLNTVAFSSHFCYSDSYGYSYYNRASDTSSFLRPRFAIKIGE